MQEKKIIVEHSTVNLAFQLEKLIHEGWMIDETHPFQSIGLHYECGLVFVGKQEDSVELAQAGEARAEGFVEEEEVKELLEKVVKEETKQEAPKAPVRQAGRPKSK